MPQDLTRLNLARFHAAGLSLRATSVVDVSAFQDWLSDYAVEDSDGTNLAVFYTAYRRSRTEHSCLASIVQVEPEAREYTFHLAYSTSKLMPFPPPEGTRPVVDILKAMASISAEHEFFCRVSFEYPSEQYQSEVALPMRLDSGAALPFTEIRGMRFVKLHEDAVLYDAIIDHGGSGDTIDHAISFVYVAGFELALPGRALVAARDISKKFGHMQK